VLSQAAPRVGPDVAPPELAQLLAELIATEPAERPADAASVAARFAELSDTTPEQPFAEPDERPPTEPDEIDLLSDNGSTDWSGLLDDALYEPEPDGDLGAPRIEPEPEPELEPMREPEDSSVRAGSAIGRRRVVSLLAVAIAGLVLLVVLPRLSQQLAPPEHFRHRPAPPGWRREPGREGPALLGGGLTLSRAARRGARPRPDRRADLARRDITGVRRRRRRDGTAHQGGASPARTEHAAAGAP